MRKYFVGSRNILVFFCMPLYLWDLPVQKIYGWERLISLENLAEKGVINFIDYDYQYLQHYSDGNLQYDTWIRWMTIVLSERIWLSKEADPLQGIPNVSEIHDDR
jgi:hypothetical protein